MFSAFGTRRCGVRCAVAAAACLLVASPAWGTLISPSGTLPFGDLGTTVASPTGDINTATSFAFASLVSVEGGTGYFEGLTPQFFGPETFSVSNPPGLQFGSEVFGLFASTQIKELDNVDGSRSFVFDGLYTRGTLADFLPNPAPATFTLNINQNAGTGAISANATLEFAAQPVPEPATLALLAMAAGSAAVIRAGRRRA